MARPPDPETEYACDAAVLAFRIKRPDGVVTLDPYLWQMTTSTSRDRIATRSI
jgi:hypothetical protein